MAYMLEVSFKVISPTRLADLRGKRSREWIAHELRKRGHGTDAKSIWRWERGHNQPSSRVLSDYAEVLGTSVESLYGDDNGDGASEDDEEAERMPFTGAELEMLSDLFKRLGVSLSAGRERT